VDEDKRTESESGVMDGRCVPVSQEQEGEKRNSRGCVWRTNVILMREDEEAIVGDVIDREVNS